MLAHVRIANVEESAHTAKKKNPFAVCKNGTLWNYCMSVRISQWQSLCVGSAKL